jgi:hypothetical protein
MKRTILTRRHEGANEVAGVGLSPLPGSAASSSDSPILDHAILDHAILDRPSLTARPLAHAKK